MRFSEYDLQVIIIRNNYTSNNLTIPNISSCCGEMDVLKLTRAGYTTEYEIKVTRADFTKDRKKVMKHCCYRAIYETEREPVEGVPNYFIYVVPQQLNLVAADVPDYAGLYSMSENRYLTAIKPPPKLHRQKFRQYWIEKIARSLNAKYLYHYFFKLDQSKPVMPFKE